MSSTPEVSKQMLNQVNKLHTLLAENYVRASVGVEGHEVVVTLPIEYFGQAQAIIRSNHISCIVRPT